ncbi:MAG: glycosyltransferase [Candidatus Eisenbacteria bacterium]|nr:glycosyltransferase [Candidatus Eisenbacteria bacterium]
MRPLKVLYLIDSLGPGGAQRQLTTLVRSLDGGLVSPEVAIYHPLYHFREELTNGGTPLHMLGPAGGRDPRVLMRLGRLMASGGFDIVHSYLRTPGVLARVASLLTPDVRIVVSERSIGLARHPWRLALERLLAGRADAVIVNSHAMAYEMLRLVPRLKARMFVVPNGVLWTEPSPQDVEKAAALRAEMAEGSELLLLALSRISREKGPDVLLEALGRLPDSTLSRLVVVWIGPRVDRELAAAVESRVAAGPLRGRVRFLGATDDPAILYMAADALVLPSRREGLPNVVLEALAHGRPVIASDVGDTGRLVDGSGAGWLVRPDDPDGLARAVEDFVSTGPERRREMGTQGSAFILENYSAGKLVERTMAVYDSVLDRRTGTRSHGAM